MPFPYTNPSQSQLQQHKKIFLGADKFVVSGTATLTRGGKGNWYWAIGASQTVDLAASLQLAQEDYASAVVNYNPSTTPNGAMTFNSVTGIYLPSGAALTAATIGVSQSTFGAAAAPTVTDILAPTALLLPTSSNIVEDTINVSPNNVLVLNPSELITEAVFQTASGGAVHFYGAILDVMLSR